MALRAQSTRQRASRCDTVRSLLMRFSVSSTIIRTRRRRRRSKNAESGSECDSYSNFGIVVTRRKPPVSGVNSTARLQRHSGVLAIAFGPDLIRELGLDTRLVVTDRTTRNRIHRRVVERAAGDHADERNELRESIAQHARADFLRDHPAFDRRGAEHCSDALLADADAGCEREARDRFVETLARRRLVSVDCGDAEDQAELLI